MTRSQMRSKGEQRKASSRVKGERLQSRCSLLSKVTRVEVCRGVGETTGVCTCSQAGAMGVVVRYARQQEGGAGLGERGCARLCEEDVWARSHDGRRGDGGRNSARGTGACVDSRSGGVGEAVQLGDGDGVQWGSGGGARRWITCNRGGRVNEAGETEEDGCVGEMARGQGPVGEMAQLGEGTDACRVRKGARDSTRVGERDVRAKQGAWQGAQRWARP